MLYQIKDPKSISFLEKKNYNAAARKEAKLIENSDYVEVKFRERKEGLVTRKFVATIKKLVSGTYAETMPSSREIINKQIDKIEKVQESVIGTQKVTK